jgi:hypothetical protein
MIPRKFGPNLVAQARILALLLALAVAGAARAAADAVGDVSLAIGVSRLVDGAGQATPITRGTAVRAGDRIETERGGHVHIRFVDGAFVIVRPGSRLVIENYRYDAARPQDSAIRFTLEEGVARAISGKAADAARDRFRLNTPIAAIGVRGTDFVVQAEPDRVRVSINSGAIVLTPLGEGCAADALGPCATSAARTLSADMGQVMLEFQRQQTVPRLIPINGAPSPDRLSPPLPEEPRGAPRGARAAIETSTELLAAQAFAEAQGLVPPPRPRIEPPPAETPVPPGTLPPAPAPTPLPPATMVWGRWANAAWAGDTMSVTYAEAIKNGRKGTVGNDYYALFRPEPPLPVLVSNLGRVDFTLRDAEVHLLRGGVAELGRVDSAWLSVDFAARLFATGIAMSNPSVGASSLQISGSVRDDGIFAVRTADGRVAGALTVDGKEAGYFFERPVTGGTFIGITRWGR